MINRYLLILLLISFPSLAVPCFSQRAQLSDCVQQLAADSVAVFFDASYILTPQACAAIRRIGHITRTGDFEGQVTDYRLSDNTLLGQFTYSQGMPDGPSVLYFSNGRPAAQGLLTKGQCSGEWRYWYPTGQLRQVLRFLVEGPPRIIAFWDSTGQQMVNNGSGRWQGFSISGLVVHGVVAQGLPTGSWQGHHPGSHLLVSTELYDRGHFRYGTLAVPQADQFPRYHYQPQLTPYEPAPFLQASSMLLGYSCAESRRLAQFRLLRPELQVPSVKVGIERYTDRLAQRLLRYRDQHWYSRLPLKATVRCVIDQEGRFTAFESDLPALREVVRRHVAYLPAWQPAHYQNGPVPGYLDITLNTATHKLVVRPAARLLPSQLPKLTSQVWPQ